MKKPPPPPAPPAEDSVFKYHDVLEIKAYKATAWLADFKYGKRELLVWHDGAKIEDIVEAIKNSNSAGTKFTVTAICVGTYEISSCHNSLTNGRKLNQDMEVVI